MVMDTFFTFTLLRRKISWFYLQNITIRRNWARVHNFCIILQLHVNLQWSQNKQFNLSVYYNAYSLNKYILNTYYITELGTYQGTKVMKIPTLMGLTALCACRYLWQVCVYILLYPKTF